MSKLGPITGLVLPLWMCMTAHFVTDIQYNTVALCTNLQTKLKTTYISNLKTLHIQGFDYNTDFSNCLKQLKFYNTIQLLVILFDVELS